MSLRILVTGAGGFIGTHLVNSLRAAGHFVRGVDVKRSSFCESSANEFVIQDLRAVGALDHHVKDIDVVAALAADIGGMGHISHDEASILRNNALIDVNTFESCSRAGVDRVVYASSACIYPRDLQSSSTVVGLSEKDAFPADPDGAYGFEKLFGEKALSYYAEQFGLSVGLARLHNVYGPYGTYDGGREKAPAALCRKFVAAAPDGTVEIWGDGYQTRSFLYVEDCVAALVLLLQSDFCEPLNVGSEQLISINEIATLIGVVAGKPSVSLVHVPGPQGVRGRNSNSERIRDVYGWEPHVSLEEGLGRTYEWIRADMASRYP